MDIRKPTENTLKVGSKNSQNNPKSKQKNTKTKKIQKLVAFFSVSFVFFLGMLIYISRLDYFTITSIEITGTTNQDTKTEVTSKINDYLDKKTLFFLPNRNIFLAQDSKIIHAIVSPLPFIQSVTIQKSGLHSLVVTVSERKPYLSVQNFPRMYIDEEGYIFVAPVESTSTTTPISETKLSLSDTEEALPIDFEKHVGEKMDQTTFNSVSNIIKIFSQKALPVYGIIVYPYNDIAFIFTQEGGVVRINTEDNLEKTISILSSAKKIDPLRSAVVKKQGIEYIDLRFGNKVFYKLTNDNGTKL